MTAMTTTTDTTLVSDLFDAIWRGEATGFSEQKIAASLAEHRKMLDDLNAKKITPARVIGTGYKKPLTLARQWLARMIAQGEADLASRGRTNAVNLANVFWRLPADHPAKAHRVTFTREDGDRGLPHLFRMVCTCEPRGECGYSAVTSHTARQVEDHMLGRHPLRND